MRRKPTQVLARHRGEHSGSDLAVTLVASVSIAAPLIFYLHQHVEMLRYGYEIEALKHERTQLVERHRELSAERNREASLERVEEQGVLLGLEPPPASAIHAVGGPEGGEESGPPGTRGSGLIETRTARLE